MTLTGYSALDAKNSGMVMAWPMPMSRSLESGKVLTAHHNSSVAEVYATGRALGRAAVDGRWPGLDAARGVFLRSA
jgi:hypothetical protein